MFLKRSFTKIRAVKKYLSGRLIMNSRQLWNSHQTHKFLRAEAIRDISNLESQKCHFQGFSRVFFTADAMLLYQNTCKTGNNAVEMSQAFQDIAQFECFTDLNVFKYAFNVIHHHYSMAFISCQQLWQKEMKVAG